MIDNRQRWQFLKKYLFWKSSCYGESTVFWKSNHSKISSYPEKVGNAEYRFSEKLAFSKN